MKQKNNFKLLTTALLLSGLSVCSQVNDTQNFSTANSTTSSSPTTQSRPAGSTGFFELTANYTKFAGANNLIGFKTYSDVDLNNADIGVLSDPASELRDNLFSNSGKAWVSVGVPGTVELRTDYVNIPLTSSNPKFSFKLAVRNSNSYWNDNDKLIITLESSDGTTSTTIIDTTGKDIDNGGTDQYRYNGNTIDKKVTDISVAIDQFKGKSVRLRVSVFVQSGAFSQNRAIGIDDIVVKDDIKTFTSSGDFATGGNWDGNAAPTASETVFIAANQTATLNGPTTVDKIVLEPGALIDTNGQTLTVNNIEVRTGSNDDNWHLYSTPVTTNFKAINDRAENTFATNTTKTAIATYDNNQVNPYIYATTSSIPTANLQPGQGFTAKLASAGYIHMDGVPYDNNANHSMPITKSGPNKTKDLNFNLLGNPYLTHLNYQQFLADNTTLLKEETIWVYNSGNTTNSGTYAGIFPKNAATGDNLSVAQGFFVIAKTAGNVEFKTTHKVTNNGTFLRTAPRTKVLLDVTDGNKGTYTELYFIENKTDGLDNGYDSSSRKTDDDFSIYSALVSDNNKKLSIQTVGRDFNKTFAIGVNAKAGKKITIGTQLENLPEGTSLILEDTVNKTTTDLTKGNYSFKLANDIKGIGRFNLIVRSSSLSTKNLTLDNEAKMFVANNTLTVKNLDIADAKLTIVDITGKTVFVKNNVTINGSKELNLPSLSAGVYIANLDSLTRKIIIE